MLRRSYGTDTADRASVQPTHMKFHYLNVDEIAPTPLERFGGGGGAAAEGNGPVCAT